VNTSGISEILENIRRLRNIRISGIYLKLSRVSGSVEEIEKYRKNFRSFLKNKKF
jgi:hypothetical protein